MPEIPSFHASAHCSSFIPAVTIRILPAVARRARRGNEPGSGVVFEIVIQQHDIHRGSAPAPPALRRAFRIAPPFRNRFSDEQPAQAFAKQDVIVKKQQSYGGMSDPRRTRLFGRFGGQRQFDDKRTAG